METVAVATIEKEMQPFEMLAGQLVVDSQDTLTLAKGMVGQIKGLREKIKGTFRPIIEKAFAAHKEAVAQEKRYLGPLDTAEGIIKGKMGGYLNELERQRRAEEERLQDLAAKDRDKRLAAIDRKIEALMGKEGDLREQLQVLTLALDASESEEEAQAIRTQINVLNAKLQITTERIQVQEQKVEEVTMPEIITVDNKPKVEGMSDRKDPVPAVVDPMALVRAIADKDVPLSVIDWNMGNIKKLIKAGVFVPGVKVEWRRNISVRV
jgi:DNA repair exonuclease SbcCD ATPase subunit